MNDRIKHILTLAFGIPLCLAAGLSGFLLITHLEGSLRTLVIAAFLLLGIGILIFYGVRSSKAGKTVEALLDILYKEVDPDTFITESEKVLKKTHNRALRSTLSLNLAVGYAAAGKYDDAIRVMKEINILSADKTSKAMFYLNAASFYAEKGSPLEAAEAYTMGQPYYEKASASIPFAHLRLVRGLLHYVEGQYEEALEAFENARKKGFDDRHSLSKLQLFEARCYAKLGKTKEAKVVYGKILQKNTYPFILASAKAESEALNA